MSANTAIGRFRYGAKVLSAVCLGAVVSTSYAIDVDPNESLTGYMRDATADPAGHTFNLLGNVVLDGSVAMDIARRETMIVYGNDYTIGRTSNLYSFNVSRNGSSLTIQNARVEGPTGGGGASPGAINVTGNDVTLNLDGSYFYNNRVGSGQFGGALRVNGTNAVVNGDVGFELDSGTGDSGGAVGVATNSDLTFTGKTLFKGNYTVNYGGAISVRENSSLTFKDVATFTGNYATGYFGGAIDKWDGDGVITFESDAIFTGNYVKNSGTDSYGSRGGAINIGYVVGTASAGEPNIQLDMQGESTFTGNYAWGANTTLGVGGAISLTASGADPLGGGHISPGYEYGANIAKGIFTDNYAYSVSGGGYGGAFFSRSYNSNVTFGSGSAFTDNMAKTLGGAIYFDQGTLNLNGNVTFSGNRHGVTFSTPGDVLTPDTNTGSANAIYFSVSSNTATLNLNSGAGEVIHFADPIESAAGKTVSVNKTGSGTVLFTEHNSDILAKTLVSQGTFELGDGVAYGRTGTVATSSFHLSNGATLKGGNNATLRASSIQLDGRLEVQNGVFNFDGSDVTLSSTSVVALTIDDIATYASINMNNRALHIDNAALEITATNYVPSQEISDTFTLVSNLSGPAAGTFLQGDSITINGAEFTIHYNANTITLQQMTVPEPSTYALILAAGMATAVWVRRHRKQRATVA